MGNEVRLTLIATGFASRDQISGVARDKEIMKTLKSLKSEDDLSVPAYMRYRGSYKGSDKDKKKIEKITINETGKGTESAQVIKIEEDAWQRAYSIFIKSTNKNERSVHLKQLRDEIIKINANNIAVDFVNSLWLLSQNENSVIDYAKMMVRFLQTLTPDYENNPIYNYYSFILLANKVESVLDFARIPIEYLNLVNDSKTNFTSIAKIPKQLSKIYKFIYSLSREPASSVSIQYLNAILPELENIKNLLLLEIHSPEIINLIFTINQWQNLIIKSKDIFKWYKMSIKNIKTDIFRP